MYVIVSINEIVVQCGGLQMSKEYFDMASSKYQAILKTYNEWENLE